jgi:hypothetical protein
MTTRAEHVAQVARRRHAVASERRRLLAFALHAPPEACEPSEPCELDEDAFDQQVTLERVSPRLARGTRAPAFGAAEASLAARVDELRARTAAFRAQAIALDAKLTEHESERAGLHAIRTQLAESSLQLEHAVDDIDAFSQLDAQLATLTA